MRDAASIRLAPLPETESLQLVEALVGVGGLPGELDAPDRRARGGEPVLRRGDPADADRPRGDRPRERRLVGASASRRGRAPRLDPRRDRSPRRPARCRVPRGAAPVLGDGTRVLASRGRGRRVGDRVTQPAGARHRAPGIDGRGNARVRVQARTDARRRVLDAPTGGASRPAPSGRYLGRGRRTRSRVRDGRDRRVPLRSGARVRRDLGGGQGARVRALPRGRGRGARPCGGRLRATTVRTRAGARPRRQRPDPRAAGPRANEPRRERGGARPSAVLRGA